MRCTAILALLAATAHAQDVDSSMRVLLNTTIKVGGTDQTIALHSGESVADAAKKFSIAHKLDKETMQTVFYFLNRKAAMAGYYKRELGTYTGLNYAGKNMPIKIFEDTNAKGLAEFLGIKLELSAAAMDALQHDLEVYIVDRVQLRMPVDLREQGIGRSYIVVKRGQSVADAVKEFKATLLNDFGFELTDAGIKSIEAGCKERLTAAL